MQRCTKDAQGGGTIKCKGAQREEQKKCKEANGGIKKRKCAQAGTKK